MKKNRILKTLAVALVLGMLLIPAKDLWASTFSLGDILNVKVDFVVESYIGGDDGTIPVSIMNIINPIIAGNPIGSDGTALTPPGDLYFYSASVDGLSAAALTNITLADMDYNYTGVISGWALDSGGNFVTAATVTPDNPFQFPPFVGAPIWADPANEFASFAWNSLGGPPDPGATADLIFVLTDFTPDANKGITVSAMDGGQTHIGSTVGPGTIDVDTSQTAVPEPGTLMLLGSGLLAAFGISRRRKA